MSFDIRLTDGDITIGADGDFSIVVNKDKLSQDVIKFISTEQGSNKFQPAIGSLINQRLIGKVLTEQNTISVLQASVQEAVSLLQKLQKQQSLTQALSPAETIISIQDITVSRDSVEPRQLNVILKLLSGDGNLNTESFTMIL